VAHGHEEDPLISARYGNVTGTNIATDQFEKEGILIDSLAQLYCFTI
jgi:hypothetical protein